MLAQINVSLLVLLVASTALVTSGQYVSRGRLGGPYARMAREGYLDKNPADQMDYIESYEPVKSDGEYSSYIQRQDWPRNSHKSKMVKKFSEFIGGK